MKDIFIVFSLGEFFSWIGIGFCFAFIFQSWQKSLPTKNIGKLVLEVIFFAVCISAIIFLISGSSLTILVYLAFGVGILSKLIFDAFFRSFIDIFFFSKPRQKAVH